MKKPMLRPHQITRLYEYLLGTPIDIHRACRKLFGRDVEPQVFDALDGMLFQCADCGYWKGPGERSEADSMLCVGTCLDCYADEEIKRAQ